MRTSGSTSPRWPMWLAACVAAVVAAVVAVAVTTASRGTVDAAYRLRAETMIPVELSVRPGDVECPADGGGSPIDFVDVGVLADSLPLYDGDLLVVRIDVVPTGSVDQVEFDLAWPSSVVGEAPPICVFVLGHAGSTATADLNVTDGRNRLVLSGARPGVITVVEIWLVADAPSSAATFRTEIEPDFATDDVVIDPFGGRVSISQRSSSVPVVGIGVDEVAGGDLYDFVATIENGEPTTRSLDVGLRIDAPAGSTWLLDDVPDGVSCRLEPTLECALGDLAAGDLIEVSGRLEPGADWVPRAVACNAPPSDAGFGFCVEALARSGGTDGPASARSQLVALPRPDAGPLTIETDPPQVVVRAGEPAGFVFTLSATGGIDLGSVELVGSDCPMAARLTHPLDDGDAFLEVGETWRYPCEIELEKAASFRIDAAGLDPEGQAVRATFEDSIRVIDPALGVAPVRGADVAVVRVTNTGDVEIGEIAISIPGCDTVTIRDGNVRLLAPGDHVDFVCDSSNANHLGAVAFGIDELGGAVSSES